MVGMGVELEKTGFRFMISPNDFLNRTYHDSDLASKVKASDAVIALRDMSKLQDIHSPGSLSIELMKRTSLESLIRSVSNTHGSEVYAKAKIDVGRTSPVFAYSSQTFVQANKLLDLFLMRNFFREFDFPGLSKNPSYVVRYSGVEGKFVAFYVPPIVEMMDKTEMTVPLSNLRRRGEREDTLTLPSVNGDGIIVISEIVGAAEELMRNASINIIPVLRDGAHRSSLVGVAGTTIHTININGSEATATSVPIENSRVVMTTKKPEKLEDRLLGYNKDSWVNLKWIGIDG